MTNKKQTKTESAKKIWHFSDGTTASEGFIESYLPYLRETCRMYAEPTLRSVADKRLREIAKVLAEIDMRDHERRAQFEERDAAIKAAFADPQYTGMATTERDRKIADKLGIGVSTVATRRPKGRRGRPRKGD